MLMWSWIDKVKKKYPLISITTLIQLYKKFESMPALLENAVERLINNEPIEYILGLAYFGPISLNIKEPLLIPRPETWDWFEKFIVTIPAPSSVLDLGCGPGTLGLGCHHFLGNNLNLTCVDINPVAIELAQVNLKPLSFKKIEFVESNWFEQMSNSGKFDLILSNPPYICVLEESWMSKNTHYEDPKALFTDFGGLSAYVEIIQHAKLFLEDDGIIVFEHGSGQGKSVLNLLKFYGFYHVKPWYDHLGSWRATSAKVML